MKAGRVPTSCSDVGLRWFAFQTRPRAEKRVHALLSSTSFESYLPIVERISQWSDRKKRVEFPLFPGYVFCQVEWEQIGDVVRTTGIVDVVRIGGQATPVSDEELDSVRALMEGAKGRKLSRNLIFRFIVFCMLDDLASPIIVLDPNALGPNSIRP